VGKRGGVGDRLAPPRTTIVRPCYENGVDVTMVPRRRPSSSRRPRCWKSRSAPVLRGSRRPPGITPRGDLHGRIAAYRIIADSRNRYSDAMRLRDKDLYQRLERPACRLDFGDDAYRQVMKYLRRGGGLYIEVGATN